MTENLTTPSGRASADAFAGRHRLWRFCRAGLGGVLILASVLKAHELATAPTLGPGLLQQRWLLLCLIELELVFGGWLLVSRGGRRTWVLTTVLWSVFFLTAVYEALSGADSCGCFGRVRIDPWYTAAFDAIVLVFLPFCRPDPPPASDAPARHVVRRWCVVATLAAAGAAFSIWNVAHVAGARSVADGLVVADGVTILEPEKWVGKSFPLNAFVDVARQWEGGDWLILIYRYDCEHCQKAVPQYDALAASGAGGSPKLSVALIEMPPYAPAGQELYGPQTRATVGRLTADREWFASTPVAVRLHDGIVQSIAEGDAAISPNSSTPPGT